MVRFFEKIASIIGVVLARIQIEEELREEKNELRGRVERQTAELVRAKNVWKNKYKNARPLSKNC